MYRMRQDNFLFYFHIRMVVCLPHLYNYLKSLTLTTIHYLETVPAACNNNLSDLNTCTHSRICVNSESHSRVAPENVSSQKEQTCNTECGKLTSFHIKKEVSLPHPVHVNGGDYNFLVL
jgi:hypothetical protein